MTLHPVDLWQYYMCCTRSDVFLCTHFVVLYLYQCGLHVALWSHIGILMRLLAAEPRSTAGVLFPSVPIWNSLADLVLNSVRLVGFKSRANTYCSLPFLFCCLLVFTIYKQLLAEV